MSSESSRRAEAKSVLIYTDAGCIGNPGPGGWAALLLYGEHSRTISGRYRNTTNNRMEMRAAIEALNALKRPCQVEIFTDSQYLRNGITKWVHGWRRSGWRTAGKKPVKNRDLWLQLLDAVERHNQSGGVSWQWTKGHAGNEGNEEVDNLANNEARRVTNADPEDVEIEATQDNLL